MYDQTEAQKATEKKVNKQGFKFSNWIPETPDANCQPVEGTEANGIMVMTRKPNRYTTEYCEINPDGTINQ